MVGYTGLFSLGQAAIYGFGAYISAILALRYGISPWLSIPISILATAVFGFLMSIPLLRLRGLFFAIATLAFNEMMYTIYFYWREVTGGAWGLMAVPSPFAGMSNERILCFYLIMGCVLVTFVVIYRIVHSAVGDTLIFIRENEFLAECLGINTMRYRIFSFTIASLFTGMAGSLFGHYLGYVGAASFTLGVSFEWIIYLLIGGAGTLIGPLLSAFALTFINEYLAILGHFRVVGFSIACGVIMLYSPRGLIGMIERAYRTFVKKRGEKKIGAP
jgi:branched-chain amino acid transport system permease protein